MTASSTTPIPPMRADWTASGGCSNGSTAPPKGATRRAPGGATTTSTTKAEPSPRTAVFAPCLAGLPDQRLDDRAAAFFGVAQRVDLHLAAARPEDDVGGDPGRRRPLFE